MIQYCFIDGPLEGQTVGASSQEPEGQVFHVEIVDVGDRALGTRFAYQVVTPWQEALPGTLRYVAGVA